MKKKSLDRDDDSKFVEQQRLMAARILKSVRMLQANSKQENENMPFEDYSMFLYRQSAPDFKERVKDLEKKLLHPVSWHFCNRINHRVDFLTCRLKF